MMGSDKGVHGNSGPLPTRRLTWEDLRFLSHELESITRGGFPMVPALASLARDMKRSRLKTVLEALHEDLERGAALEEALARQGDRFPPLMVALIRAGEAAGNLPGVLALMSAHAGNMCRVTQTLKTALIYPAVLVVAGMVILGYLLVAVVPPFQETFAAFGLNPPGITRFFFAGSALLRDHGMIILGGLAVAAALLYLLARVVLAPETRRHGLDIFLLMLPWYGRMYHGILQARFSRTLHLMLSSRLPAVESVVLSGAATGSSAAERASVAASRQAVSVVSR